MKTLVLYCNDNGDPRRCLLQHHIDIRQFDITSGLPEYNPGGGCFIIRDQPDDYDPFVEDGDDREIITHYIMLADKPDITLA